MKAFFAALLFMTIIFVAFSRDIPGPSQSLCVSDHPRTELPIDTEFIEEEMRITWSARTSAFFLSHQGLEFPCNSSMSNLAAAH